LLFAAVSTVSCYLHGGAALGATDSWLSVGGNWTASDTSDWSTGAVPGLGDTVNITNADDRNRFIGYDYSGSSVTISSLTLNNTGGGLCDLLISNNGLTLNAESENVGDSNTATLSGSGGINQSAGDNAINKDLYMGTFAEDNGQYVLGGTGTLAIAGTAGCEYVGNGGTATFFQSAGLNLMSNSSSLIIASTGGAGIYSLTDNGALIVGGNETVGAGGSGSFMQAGGTNSVGGLAYIGYESSGFYSLTSGTFQVAPGGGEYIGVAGNGTFNQTGGANSLPSSSLILGDNSGFSGIYSLGGSGMLTAGGNEYLGYYGSGTFNQSGGSNTVSVSVYFGQESKSSGAYSLSGTGSMSVGGSLYLGANMGSTGSCSISGGSLKVGGDENIGDSRNSPSLPPGGTGNFNQSGGSNQVAGSLNLGSFSHDNGTFSLSGSGALSVAGSEYIGNSGAGTFTQSGGTNNIGPSSTSAGNLYIAANSGSTGQYSLSGTGAITVQGGAFAGGSSAGPGGAASLIVSGGSLTVNGMLEIWNSTGTAVTQSGGTVRAGNTVNQATLSQFSGASVLGAVTGSGSLSVGAASGAAAATMTTSGLNQSSVTINSTGLLTLDGGSGNTVNALIISGNGDLDLTNHHLIISYGTGADPATTILGYLKTGDAGGHWNGSGIESSIAAANHAYGIAFADGAARVAAGISSGQIRLAYALYGDITQAGEVSGTDFGILANNFGRDVTGGWEQGDFNYQGKVSATDFGLLAANFGKTASGTAVLLPASDWAALDSFALQHDLLANVPEPESIGIFALAAGATLSTRRRRNAGNT
jgi:hypothetical protein